MENKKTKIAIIILTMLIALLIITLYFYMDFNTKQLNLLTQEVNKILESNLKEDTIDFKTKTEKNYKKVEGEIKEYVSKLKEIYVEMNEMVSGINPDSIFSAQNMPDKKLDKIDEIVDEYKEKSRELIAEYDELVTEEKISENISDVNFSERKDYYINLYKEIMLSEVMQNQYIELEEEIKNEKAGLYEKLNKIEKIKDFLEENQESWIIKDDKIQIVNSNRITEYYNLINQLID